MKNIKYHIRKRVYATNNDITIDRKVIEDKSIKRVLKNNHIHTIKAKQLSDLCGLPKPDEQFRIITEKQFNAYSLILQLLESEVIDEMYLAIYRINKETVESLINFIESGKIKRATFVISNFFNQTRRPEKWALMLRGFAEGNENVNHVYTHNHSKVLAVKTSSGSYYVFEGSGNMSDNARIEQYIYENSKVMFDFHKEWMLSLIKE